MKTRGPGVCGPGRPGRRPPRSRRTSLPLPPVSGTQALPPAAGHVRGARQRSVGGDQMAAGGDHPLSPTSRGRPSQEPARWGTGTREAGTGTQDPPPVAEHGCGAPRDEGGWAPPKKAEAKGGGSRPTAELPSRTITPKSFRLRCLLLCWVCVVFFDPTSATTSQGVTTG